MRKSPLRTNHRLLDPFEGWTGGPTYEGPKIRVICDELVNSGRGTLFQVYG